MTATDITEAEHGHPGDAQYILIAVALAVLTAIEVGLYYLKHDTATTAVLLLLMALKFVIVVGFFMHLKFDSVLLRRLFSGGLVLAVFIYVVTLFMFGAFHV
ncbi:MAG: cytochrome C oxidase subunit IV family protein [Acidimicrobiales bacterium]